MTGTRKPIKFFQADVFTERPFGGNPVAVFPEPGALSDRELQQIAREMNLSETVFVFPAVHPSARAKLRIFTPSKELPFAGHPVIGTFFVLGKLGFFPLDGPVVRTTFECNLGTFPIELSIQEGEIVKILMSQPQPEFLGAVTDFQDLFDVSEALGLSRTQISKTKLPLEVVSTGLPILIVPIRTLTAVRSIRPNVTAINEICDRVGANGILAFTTMTVEEDSAVHTRMFASPIGVQEDPATGSASGALGAYLVQNGVVEVGPTTEIIAEQGYELGRPSRIFIIVESDDDVIQAVKVGGQAVMVLEGKLTTDLECV